jgi:hypothetical protein
VDVAFSGALVELVLGLAAAFVALSSGFAAALTPLGMAQCRFLLLGTLPVRRAGLEE